MKTLSEREQDIQRFIDRPVELAQRLAEDVRDFCHGKPALAFVTVDDSKDRKVTITRQQQVLIIDALGKDSVDSDEADKWRVGDKILSENQMLDAILAFLRSE
jgi:hypothetical protein